MRMALTWATLFAAVALLGVEALQSPHNKNQTRRLLLLNERSGCSGKESNWLPTKASGRFEVLFRLYGPEKPFFDKTWKLPDIEKMKQ